MIILKTTVGDGKLTQSFEPESLKIVDPFTIQECASHVLSDSESKSCVTLPSRTTVCRIIREARCENTLFITSNGELISSKENQDSVLEAELECAIYKGRDEGEKRGYAKAVEDLKQLMTLLHTIADRLMEQKKQLLTQLKPEVVDFALSIAEKIIRKELSDPKAHEKLVHSYLNQAMKIFVGEALRVYLAPDDLVMFQERFPLEGGNITYLADSLLQQGDCKIVAKSGLLSAQITRELGDLRDKLSYR